MLDLKEEDVITALAVSNVSFDVLVHVQDVGDLHAGPDQEAGKIGKSIEGFQITFSPPVAGLGLRYKAHLSETGDTGWVTDGKFVGTRGENRSLEGFVIEVTGVDPALYDLQYMGHLRDGSSTGWVSNGGFCGTRGKSISLDWIRIKIVANLPNFDVLVHVQDVGDLHAKPDQDAGKTGKSIEGFQITFTPPVAGLGLQYMARNKNGASAWERDGTFVGTRGKNLPLEGFAIELVGETLAQYDVLYMAHIRDGSDTGWMANGTFCGTSGKAIDLIRIKIAFRQPNYLSLISKAASGSGKPLLITAPYEQSDTRVLVSAPARGDLDVWDRRPVRSGQGFVLINKKRPTMCIARHPLQQPAVLKDVKNIWKDDTCVWRDDSVPGAFNAINSWTNWELKLNMAGNPPYRDTDNILLVYPWASGADNELWRQNKATYDLVAGCDREALNDVSWAIYQICYPKIFKGSLPVGALGIQSVDFDITTAPIFDLSRSKLYQEHVLESLGDAPGLGSESVLEAAAATLTVGFPAITLSVHADQPKSASCSLEVSARVEAKPNRTLVLRLITGKLDIPSDPDLTNILNEYFVPLLVDYLNKNVLDPIAIPEIDLLGVQLAAPAIDTHHPNLLIATSVLPDSTVPPPPGRWPVSKAFCGADESLLNAAFAAALASYKIADHWKDSFDVWLGTLYVEAGYELRFTNPRFTVRPQSGNTYKVKIDIQGHARFKAELGILSASPGAGASGSVEVTAAVSVNPDNHVIVTFKTLDSISLNWSFDGLPWWLDKVISEILSVFNPVVLGAVTLGLNGHEFDVYTIPTVDATIGGTKLNIRLKDLQIGSQADAAGKPLLLVTGGADVKVK